MDEPRKPITKTQHGQHSDLKRWCPSCMERLYRKTDKCPHCGQKIKWSKTNGTSN